MPKCSYETPENEGPTFPVKGKSADRGYDSPEYENENLGPGKANPKKTTKPYETPEEVD